MSDDRLNSVRDAFDAMLPEMKLEGLAVGEVRFDFYSESYDVCFRWQDQSAWLRFPVERIVEFTEGRPFVAKRLRKELYAALNVDEDAL